MSKDFSNVSIDFAGCTAVVNPKLQHEQQVFWIRDNINNKKRGNDSSNFTLMTKVKGREFEIGEGHKDFDGKWTCTVYSSYEDDADFDRCFTKVGEFTCFITAKAALWNARFNAVF